MDGGVRYRRGGHRRGLNWIGMDRREKAIVGG
jgi:hypothetical protein